MTYKVMFLEYAERDLRTIHAYIANQFSETLAKRVYSEIRDAVLLLEDNPNLGHMIPQLSKLGVTDYRYMVIGKRNKVVYELDVRKKYIYIYLICNDRQDFDAVFAKRMLEM
jgi:plasmid stabilization system protein ParE